MLVRDFMTSNPVTVTPDTTIPEIAQIMNERGFKRIPVVSNGQLLGLMTDKELMHALPSPATALSKHEINYLTSKITASEVMAKNLITIEPDVPVEKAVTIMRHHDIGCLPVVENGQLVGIITESNLFDALSSMLGLHRPGIRLTIQVQDRLGVLAEITNIVRDLNITIISLATIPNFDDTAKIILRLATDDPEPVIGALEAQGFQVVHSSYLP